MYKFYFWYGSLLFGATRIWDDQMNQHLRRLEDQCWEERVVEGEPIWYFNTDKFSKLIITEVTDILSTYRTSLKFLDGFEYNGVDPITAIEKHFGITDDYRDESNVVYIQKLKDHYLKFKDLK